jgi:hypothetical protein
MDSEEADFFRQDFIPYSMEYYLKISNNCDLFGCCDDHSDHKHDHKGHK